MSKTIQIKHRFTEAVLFECDAPDGLGSGMQQRHALEKAVSARANLGGANLYGANLGGADLRGANLGDKKLIGERPVMMIGPIGSRADYFTAYLTDAGIYLRAGCLFGTVAEFTAKLDAEHGDNAHGQEYRAALALIECHAKLWTPTAEGGAA